MNIDWMCLLKAIGCTVAVILMVISFPLGVIALLETGPKTAFQKVLSAYGVLVVVAMVIGFVGSILSIAYLSICP